MGIHSVSEITRYIKSLLENERPLRHLLVRGEVSNFKRYPSGHCYFTLKDAASQLKCVMFRSHAQHLRFQPTNGLQVIAEGSIAVYERDGIYQLYAESLVPEGTGSLELAFEQLKEKLAAEGLFDETHKKPLVRFPRKIGVVTSAAGAVLRDIYHVVSHRWPLATLVLYPVQVQGEGAAEQIAAGIEFFNQRYPVDTLIVGRGGGSREDLWAFNEETVVRAVYHSKIPVISAVGHETDFSLSDFASDVRAATPSQAAELAVPDRQELKRYIESLDSRLSQRTRRELDGLRQRLEYLRSRPALSQPGQLLAARRQQLDFLDQRLRQAAAGKMQSKRHRLDIAMGKLDMLSPVQVLRRGYSLLEKEGRMVTRAGELQAGDQVSITLQDGKVMARIETD